MILLIVFYLNQNLYLLLVLEKRCYFSHVFFRSRRRKSNNGLFPNRRSLRIVEIKQVK
jgi:hypothetical protein